MEDSQHWSRARVADSGEAALRRAYPEGVWLEELGALLIVVPTDRPEAGSEALEAPPDPSG